MDLCRMIFIKTWRKKHVISWYIFINSLFSNIFKPTKKCFFFPTLESWRMADSVLDHVCYIRRRNASLLSVDVGRVAAMGNRPWGSEKRRQRGITHGRAKLNVFKCTSLRKNPTFLDATAGIPVKWLPKLKTSRYFILMTRHYPDVGSVSDWLKICLINQLEALSTSG